MVHESEGCERLSDQGGPERGDPRGIGVLSHPGHPPQIPTHGGGLVKSSIGSCGVSSSPTVSHLRIPALVGWL